jgi:hypothetical protein
VATGSFRCGSIRSSVDDHEINSLRERNRSRPLHAD